MLTLPGGAKPPVVAPPAHQPGGDNGGLAATGLTTWPVLLGLALLGTALALRRRRPAGI